MPDEDKNFGGSLVLDFRKWWRHMQAKNWYSPCFVSEIHEQTLGKLRQELTQISQDEWMYKPIDQIIGFWTLMCTK